MAEGYRFCVVRTAVRPSIRPSQTCWGYISKTITDFNMKRQGCIYLIEEMCTAQETQPNFRVIALCFLT